LNNKDEIIKKLTELNLSKEEAQLYVELLKGPSTHLRLSHITGINRTKVYRLIEQLEQRSLVGKRNDDRGTFILARDYASLEIAIIAQEEQLKQQRKIFQEIGPELELLKIPDSNKFTINTYEGTDGFKQMQWHELRTKGEILVFGNVTVEELVDDRRWSEKFRIRTTELGYTMRELVNIPYENPIFTDVKDFMQNVYTSRSIPKEQLPIGTPIVIYNDTVAIYQHKHEQRVGIEIVNKTFAKTMRHIFEHYWQMAKIANVS